MKKFKPEVSAGKAGALGALLGLGATGSLGVSTALGVAAGVGQAVANRKEARQMHSALRKEQFNKQANYSKDL